MRTPVSALSHFDEELAQSGSRSKLYLVDKRVDKVKKCKQTVRTSVIFYKHLFAAAFKCFTGDFLSYKEFGCSSSEEFMSTYMHEVIKETR